MRPRYLLMVLAFAGDSTTIKALPFPSSGDAAGVRGERFLRMGFESCCGAGCSDDFVLFFAAISVSYPHCSTSNARLRLPAARGRTGRERRPPAPPAETVRH